MKWKHRVALKHLLTKEEDYDSVQKSMNEIADVLEKETCFRGFEILETFRELPRGNGVFSVVDYANALMDLMYDFADQNAIWIE